MLYLSGYGVFQRESDLQNLSVKSFDLPSQLKQLLVLLLSARGVLFLPVVRELVDLEGIVEVL